MCAAVPVDMSDGRSVPKNHLPLSSLSCKALSPAFRPKVELAGAVVNRATDAALPFVQLRLDLLPIINSLVRPSTAGLKLTDPILFAMDVKSVIWDVESPLVGNAAAIWVNIVDKSPTFNVPLLVLKAADKSVFIVLSVKPLIQVGRPALTTGAELAAGLLTLVLSAPG